VRSASLTIASPIAPARTIELRTSTPWSAPSALASSIDSAARASSSCIGASSGRSSGTLTTCNASTRAPCSWASFTAVATISSPIWPSFIGTRMLLNVASGTTCSSVDVTCSNSPAPRSRRTSR
jgi:hypothetical protein